MAARFAPSSPRSPPRSLEAAVEELCNRCFDMLAFGAVIRDGPRIRMRDVPAWRCRHAGELDDPDFNNVHAGIDPRSITTPSSSLAVLLEPRFDMQLSITDSRQRVGAPDAALRDE